MFLLSMEDAYRVQTTHMFEVALAVLEPPSPLAYWYQDEDEDHPNIALSMPIKALTMQEIEERTSEVYRRVNGRCKGLLEVTQHFPDGFQRVRVNFLHRTIKDFFLTTDPLKLLAGGKQKEFVTSSAICRASLAEPKGIATVSPVEAPSVMLAVRNFFSRREVI
jgi:hypothetical protein